jgi:myo-inositol-1(or 4)-monophosphatase
MGYRLVGQQVTQIDELNTMDLETRLLEVATDAADGAGKRILRLFNGKEISIRRKFDYPGSIVTNADNEAERVIVTKIKKTRIKCTIHSEEAGTLRFGSRDIVWAVDPLDGTFNYATGIPYFGVSIGALIRGRACLGAIYNPILDEMFTAIRGDGANLNGNQIRVSTARSLRNSKLIFEWWHPEPSIPDPLALVGRLYAYTRSVRSPGSVALNLCSVASGRFDGLITVYRKAPVYETTAGCLIAQEAGARLTSSIGKSWESYAHSVIAGGRPIHHQLMRLIRS